MVIQKNRNKIGGLERTTLIVNIKTHRKNNIPTDAQVCF